jgi:hypothetical protein
LIDLAEALGDKGVVDLKQEMDRGENSDLFRSLLTVLKREKILIIIDEFQRLIPQNDTWPPKSWQQLVEALNNSPNANGRIMLISNRSIKTARWCENCAVRSLGGLSDTEATAYLSEILESANLSAKIPAERRVRNRTPPWR